MHQQSTITLDQVFQILDANAATATELVETHTPSQLNRQPDNKKWSALQCLQHLALTNEVLGKLMERNLGESHNIGPDNQALSPNWIWRMLLSSVEAKRLKGFAPKQLQPPSSLDPTQTLAALLQTHNHLQSLRAKCAGKDLNNIQFRHPFLYIKISVATTFILIASHEQRHLAQAARAVA